MISSLDSYRFVLSKAQIFHAKNGFLFETLFHTVFLEKFDQNRHIKQTHNFNLIQQRWYFLGRWYFCAHVAFKTIYRNNLCCKTRR